MWTNTAGGNWNGAANWSPSQVPGAADTAVITNDGTYTVSLNVNAMVAGLELGGVSGTQTLSSASATLSLSGAGTVGARGAFVLSGGVLDGVGTLTVDGRFDWQSGTMQGSGQTVFSPAAVVTLSTSSQKNLRDRTVTLAGTATWSGGAWYGGGGAVVNVQNGATLDVTSESGAPVWFGAITLNNAGTIRKNSGTGLSYFNWTVNNSGVIRALSGSLGFYGGGAQNGTFEAATTPNMIHFGGGRHELLPGVSFAGAGLFSIGDSADVRFQTNMASNHRWRLSGNGALNGTNSVVFTFDFDWQGGTMGDTGQTSFGLGNVLRLTTASTKFVRERTLSISGTATWQSGPWYGGFGATVNVQGGAVLDVQSEAGAPVWAGAITLNNAGLIHKVTGTGLSFFNWTVNNSGIVNVQTGTLGLYGGGAQTGLFQTGNSAIMHFGGGRHEMLAGVNFTGVGGFSIGDSGDVRFQTALTNGANWRLSGNGALNGTNVVTFAGLFEWHGGTMGDIGQTVFRPGSFLHVMTSSQKNLRDRTLTLQGFAVWSGGAWYGGGGAVVNVQGGATLDATTEAGAPVWFGAITLNVAGTLRKSTGAGLGYFNWTVNNSGTVEAQSGTLGFYGGGAHTGLFQSAAPGTRIHFAGGGAGSTHDLLAGVGFAGPGLFTIGDSGYVRVQAPLTTGLRWQLLPAGILGGTNAVTFTGPFDWQGGQMQDAGQTIFSPGSAFTITTSSQKNLRDRTVALQGLALWSGGAWYGGGGAVVNVQNGATLDVTSEGGAPVWFGAITLNNAGTVRKSAGVGLSYFNWTMNNSGTVDAQTGTLGFYGGGAHTGLFRTTAAATRIHFAGGGVGNTHDLLGGVDFTGAGLFTVGDSGYVRVQTLLTTGRRWQLLPAGILGGTNTVTFTGPFDWQGGQMQDTGQTFFSPSSVVSISTGNQKNLRDRCVNIAGTMTWTGGTWYGGGGAVVNILASGVLDAQSEGGAPVWFGTILLNNHGSARARAQGWPISTGP